MKSAVFVITLVSLVGISSAAISCFRCTYYEGHKHSQEKCLDANPGYEYSVTCSTHTEAYCRKIENKALEDQEDRPMKIVYRDCYYPNATRDLADQCKKLEEDFPLPQIGYIPKMRDTMDCYCMSDKCNAGSGFAPSFLLIGGFAVVKFFGLI